MSSRSNVSVARQSSDINQKPTNKQAECVNHARRLLKRLRVGDRVSTTTSFLEPPRGFFGQVIAHNENSVSIAWEFENVWGTIRFDAPLQPWDTQIWKERL